MTDLYRAAAKTKLSCSDRKPVDVRLCVRLCRSRSQDKIFCYNVNTQKIEESRIATDFCGGSNIASVQIASSDFVSRGNKRCPQVSATKIESSGRRAGFESVKL